MIRIILTLMVLIFPSLGYGQSIKSFTPTLLYAGVQQSAGSTFQAHMRHVAVTFRGCYFSHQLREAGTTAAQNETAAIWFTPNCDPPYTLIDTIGPYNGAAPALLADNDGTVYSITGNDTTGANWVQLRKYGCGASPSCLDMIATQTYPGILSTKWTALFSNCYGQGSLYTFSFATNNFTVFNRDLSIYDSYQLTQNGSISGLEYPYLSDVCYSGGGYIFAGILTSATSATIPSYDGIHVAVNVLNGHRDSWDAPQNGNVLSLPIISDDTGPLAEFRPSFLPAGSSAFLGAMTATAPASGGGADLHFTFASNNASGTPDQTEEAFHWTGSSVARTALHDNLMQGGATSVVGGATLRIHALDEQYFEDSSGNQYLIGSSDDLDANGKHWIDVLISTDKGLTWNDYAKSSITFSIPYSMNCMQKGLKLSTGWINADKIVCEFTNLTSSNRLGHEVYTFHLSVIP